MELGTEFAIRGGRRGPLRMWLLVLAVVLLIAVTSLIGAVNSPVSDASGGAGHVVIPFAGTVFSALALVVIFGQWWEDATFFDLEGDRLRVRHGTNKIRGRATWYERTEHITLSGEGARGTTVLFLDQEGTRVRLGEASAIMPLQSSRLQEWLRAAGFAVDRRWEGSGS